MEPKYSKSNVTSSLIWKLMERGGTQVIQFIVQIILARLLLPEDFGTIAIVMVFISFAQVFVQSGFKTALIQKKDASNEDFSSIFFVILVEAILLYIIIYFSAPFVANFYENSILIPTLRVLAFTLFFVAFNSIQYTYITKNMMFEKLFYSSLGAILISGIAGIIASYKGLGVWALVIQQLLNQISITVILWFTVSWRPCLVFSIKKVKKLFSFGWKLLASSLLNVLFNNIRTLIIGKVYTPSILGYYNRGQRFPDIIVSNIDESIQSVLLPTLSAHQDNRNSIKLMMRRTITSSSFVIFPMMIGLAVVAEPLIKIVLTYKWLPSVPFLKIFCIAYALRPINSANSQAINAIGRSDIFLVLEIIKKVIALIILIISLPYGVYVITLGQVLSDIISTFINAYPNKQLLDYSYKEQLIDIIPPLLIAIIMGAIVFLFTFLEIAAWKLIVLQVCAGAIVYILLAKIFKIESLFYLVTTIMQLLNK